MLECSWRLQEPWATLPSPASVSFKFHGLKKPNWRTSAPGLEDNAVPGKRRTYLGLFPQLGRGLQGSGSFCHTSSQHPLVHTWWAGWRPVCLPESTDWDHAAAWTSRVYSEEDSALSGMMLLTCAFCLPTVIRGPSLLSFPSSLYLFPEVPCDQGEISAMPESTDHMDTMPSRHFSLVRPALSPCNGK